MGQPSQVPFPAHIGTGAEQNPHAFLLAYLEKLSQIAVARLEVKAAVRLFMVIPEHVKRNGVQAHGPGSPDAVPPVLPGDALGMHLRSAYLERFSIQHELLVPFPAELEHGGGSTGRSGLLHIPDSPGTGPCQCSHSGGHQGGSPTETILLHHAELLIHLKTVANHNFTRRRRTCEASFPSPGGLPGPDGRNFSCGEEYYHVIRLHSFARKPEGACLNSAI